MNEKTKNGINKVEEIDSLHVSIFMTQNPYTQSKIKIIAIITKSTIINI